LFKKQKSAFQKIKLSDFERKKKKFFEFRIMGCLERVLERKVWICEKNRKRLKNRKTGEE
jgi:hypothetical protein